MRYLHRINRPGARKLIPPVLDYIIQMRLSIFVCSSSSRNSLTYVTYTLRETSFELSFVHISIEINDGNLAEDLYIKFIKIK